MNIWLVSSEVTFIPENYLGVLESLASHPHVRGLILLKNRSAKLFGQALAFWLSGLAPHLGKNLMINTLTSFRDPRRKLFTSLGKTVAAFDSMNAPAALQWVREHKIDLLINARTRDIYRTEILNAPTYGCINIHHGVLPDQRGVFCDLWALREGRPAGFTIHRMTPKLDDGEILHVEVVSAAGEALSYPDYLRRGPRLEGARLRELIDQLIREQRWTGSANGRSPHTRYFRNPRLPDLLKFRQEGFRI